MTARRAQVIEHRFGGGERPLKGDRAVGLADACRLLGFSVRTGRRLLHAGAFPIPELPPLRVPRQRIHHRFSTVLIREYLADASTNDAKAARR